MHHRADWNRVLYDVHAQIGDAEFAHQRQTLVDVFLAEVAHVEHDALAPRCGDGVALLQFVPVGLADAVAWAEFHGLELRFAQRGFRAHAVILQVTPAILVEQHAAFAAAGFGQQTAGVGQTGRVVLHKLHVLERNAGTVGHGHAVAGLDRAVGAEREYAPGAAASDDDRLGVELLDHAAAHFHGGNALATAVFDQQVERIVLVKAGDAGELQGGLEQRVQDVKTRLVGCKPGALFLHAAKGANRHRAIGFAVPGAAPVLQLC